jgi:hypothetical protein
MWHTESNAAARSHTFYRSHACFNVWLAELPLTARVRIRRGRASRRSRTAGFCKPTAFFSGGYLRSNNPADQENAIVYNELVANAVALQNVVDQTQALHTLKSKGVSIHPADLAFLSPYATSKLKRFGDCPTNLTPEAMPPFTNLPQLHPIDVAGFYENLADGPTKFALLGAYTAVTAVSQSRVRLCFRLLKRR